MATDIIGGAGDMFSLCSVNPEVETTAESCEASEVKSEPVPVKLEPAAGAVELEAAATSSPCTMAGDHSSEQCTDQPVTMEIAEMMNIPVAPSNQGQENKPVQLSLGNDATSTPAEVIQPVTLAESNEQVSCHEGQAISPKAEEQGTTVMQLAAQLPLETGPEPNHVLLAVTEETFEMNTDPVTQACSEIAKMSEPTMNEGFPDPTTCHLPCQDKADGVSSAEDTNASKESNQSSVSLPAPSTLNTEQALPNASEMPDLAVFTSPIIDPTTTASFCAEGNHQASFSQASQPASSLGPFNAFSQQQAVVDSLPGINSFSPSSSLVQGVTGNLSSCSSSGLTSGNISSNVLYAAVPLQQTAGGMQLAPLHPDGNAYTLARPSGPTRRVLLPRGRSAGNTSKENSFKETITALTCEKPNVGLVQQIMEVFRATGRREMQPCEVYDGLECCYPYYLRMNPNRKKSWMSSVRHALTTPCFKSRRAEDSDGKLAPRKGSFWSINNSYDPNAKPPKRTTPVKRSLNSPQNYQRRPLGVNPQQANWQPFPGHNHPAQQHHSTRHSPYGYFSPTRGSFSPIGPSGIPVVYSPTRVYQPQTPTAALLPNGKMVYLSPADDDAGCHHHPLGHEMYQAWGANSTTANHSLWQVVQNVGNEHCKDQTGQNRIFCGTSNAGQQQQQHQQQQGSVRYSADCTAVTNMNCNNTTPLGFAPTTQQQQEQLKMQLLQQAQLQQQIQQQQLLQQQQQQALQQQQQVSAEPDPFTVALELSEIKGKQGPADNDQPGIQPQQDAASINSSAQQAMTIAMTCTPEPQTILVGAAQSTQQLSAKESVDDQSQQGCDELRNMVYHSLGVCNDLDTQRAANEVAQPTQLTATPVTQFSALPTTQYQLIHYNGTGQQYEGMVI